MRIARHKLQVFLFLAAILVPAAVLVGLAGRMIVQDRELAAKHLVDQRSLAVDKLRRELSARLEAVRLQEIENASHRRDSANPAVVFTATVEDDRLVLPWEISSPRDSPAFAGHKQKGETAEFAKKDEAGAVAAYRLALASAASPSEVAEARLLLARVLSKSGKNEEAFRLYQAMLDAPADARDEQGVGYRFYALERLVAGKQQPAVDVIGRNGDRLLTLPELYLIRSLPVTQSTAISQRIAEMEQAAALARDFERVRARVEAVGAPSGSAWVPYGDDQWLVTIAAPQPPLPEFVLAVSSAKVAPPGVRFGTRMAGADALGDPFPGLDVEWSDPRMQ